MRRYVYATGALLGILLTVLATVLIAVRTGPLPPVVSLGPLLLALVTCVVSWWLQALIVAVLVQPRLGNLRVGDMFRIYMAGTFVVNVSPFRGPEIPYEVCLLRRLGLPAAEGSAVVLGRILLDVVVLTPVILGGLIITAGLPAIQAPELLLAGLAIATIWAAGTLLVSRRSRGKMGSEKLQPGGSGRWAKVRKKVLVFFTDMLRSLDFYRRREQRATLVRAVVLTPVYWVFRLSCAPLALMAVGWSGEWMPVIMAQVLLNGVILPFVPTPGGSGTRELVFVSLLSAHIPDGQLLGGLVLYTGLTYALPAIVGAFFFGEKLLQGLDRNQRGTDVSAREDHA